MVRCVHVREDQALTRRPAVITQADLLRALKAARKVGMTVEIRTDGSLLIVPLPTEDPAPVAVQQPPVAPARKWVP